MRYYDAMRTILVLNIISVSLNSSRLLIILYDCLNVQHKLLYMINQKLFNFSPCYAFPQILHVRICVRILEEDKLVRSTNY